MKRISIFLVFIAIVLSGGLIIISFYNSSWNWIEIAYWISGTIVPLITLASFFLVLSNLKVQQKQLINQKKEINLNQEKMEEQNRMKRLQRFESTFFLLIEKLNGSYNKIKKKDPNRFKIIYNSLQSEISNEVKELIENKEYTASYNEKKLCSEFYDIIYDKCVNIEEYYPHLGLESISIYFLQIIKLLKQNESIIENAEYYFDFIILELEEDVLNLLVYLVIYVDYPIVINYLNDNGFLSKMSSISAPINISDTNKEFWEFIVRNTEKSRVMEKIKNS
jgi:hypothetical protein